MESSLKPPEGLKLSGNVDSNWITLFVYLFGSPLAMLSSIASLPGVPTTLNIHTLLHTLKNTTVKKNN